MVGFLCILRTKLDNLFLKIFTMIEEDYDDMFAGLND
jgi:hypothetical protein